MAQTEGLRAQDARVYSFLQTQKKPVAIEEIVAETEESYDKVLAALDALMEGGLCARTKKGRYALPERMGMVAGTVMTTLRGTAFLRPLEGDADYRLDMPDEIALNQDLVLARVSDPVRKRAELSEILRRKHTTLTAVLKFEQPGRGERGRTKGKKGKREEGKKKGRVPKVMAVPTDRHLPQEMGVVGSLSGVREGDMALLRITRWPTYKKRMQGELLKVMGPAHEVSVQLDALVSSHGLATEFDGDALLQAEAMPSTVRAQDMVGRADFREMQCFTIDGADAKDFDDAVSLAWQGDTYTLGVHIADVSHYVAPGTAIDRNALERGTSVYLPGRTLPMLPEQLSNHLCSLMPEVDRLAISILFTIIGGEVASFTFQKSVIHSKARLTYEGVNQMLAGDGDGGVPEALCDTLREMVKLSDILRKKRHARGSIDFDLPEPHIELNDEGEPVAIAPRERGAAHLLIEDFMLIANETMAAWAREHELPFLYRVHEQPDAEKVQALEVFLHGLHLKPRLGDKPSPMQYQKLLAEVAGTPEAGIVQQVMLRSLKRAGYSAAPKGHFGLAAKDYCHFTSPIRRYPDLVVHRMLKLLASGGMEHKQHEPWESRMPDLASQTSEREAAATSAEREADDLMKAHFMARHIGDTFEGVVSGVVSWGYFVTLPSTVEGLVHISQLSEPYTLNEAQYCLIGQRTGRVIRLGDRAVVEVERVDLASRQVHFAEAEARPE